VGIDASTWAPDLANKHDHGLLNLGWSEVSRSDGVLLCKQGIGAKNVKSIECDKEVGNIWDQYDVRRFGNSAIWCEVSDCFRVASN